MSGLKAAPEKPHIPDLNERDEIDLDKLGADALVVRIKYTGMDGADTVSPRWIGANPGGDAFDDTGAGYPVDPIDGVEVKIDNATIRGAAGGWAFLSYTVFPSGGNPLESLRQFCYVGVRPQEGGETLAVLQALPSHGLVIQPRKLPVGGVVTVLVAPYQAMQPGDKVHLKVVGYDEDGVKDDDWSRTLLVDEDHFDKEALSATVPKNFFSLLEKGHAEGSYSIELKNGSKLDSPVQRWEIDSGATLPQPLEKPAIDGYAEGEPLEPAKLRSGVTIRVPVYPSMASSDRVVMHWRSPVGDLIQSVRVDPSTMEAASIPFQVSGETLAANGGTTVWLSYQYGRPGESLSSSELQVEILPMREALVAPDIRGANPDATPDWGTMEALSGIDGVYVVVPTGVVAPGERVQVHWIGHSEWGQYVAKEPASTADPLRFFIPAQYVVANMARGDKDESRRFKVFYRVINEADEADYFDSVAYHLRVAPLPHEQLPQIICKGVSGKELPLSEVPEDGADLELETWYFIAEKQLLTLSIVGVTAEGEQEYVFHDAIEVSPGEVETGVKAKLPKDILKRLIVGERFTLYPRLSYDGGIYYTPFRVNNLTLVD